jgi:hypothetical protein
MKSKGITILIILLLGSIGLNVYQHFLFDKISQSPIPASPESPVGSQDREEDEFTGDISLTSTDELARHLEAMKASESIDEKVALLAQSNDFIFHPDNEEVADRLISAALEYLRREIVKEVAQIDKEAIAAGSSREALILYDRATALVQMLPAPSLTSLKFEEVNVPENEEEAKASQERITIEFLSSLMKARQRYLLRIQDISKLRYNQWANDQIVEGFKELADNQSIFNPGDEDPDIINGVVGAIGDIDPGHLAMATVPLYQALVSDTKETLSDVYSIHFTNRLSDPSLKRKHPSDF